MCQILCAAMGTKIPSGKISVGDKRAVVDLLSPYSTALRNLTLSDRATGSR